MLDETRAGKPEDYRKMAEYLATINLSAVDKWDYPLKTLPRASGRATRAVVTEYDMKRPTTRRTTCCSIRTVTSGIPTSASCSSASSTTYHLMQGLWSCGRGWMVVG